MSGWCSAGENRDSINELFHPQKIIAIVNKTKEVSYQDMATSELEELLLDYENEKRGLEARKEWLTNECEELQRLIDDRAEG